MGLAQMKQTSASSSEVSSCPSFRALNAGGLLDCDCFVASFAESVAAFWTFAPPLPLPRPAPPREPSPRPRPRWPHLPRPRPPRDWGVEAVPSLLGVAAAPVEAMLWAVCRWMKSFGLRASSPVLLVSKEKLQMLTLNAQHKTRRDSSFGQTVEDWHSWRCRAQC